MSTLTDEDDNIDESFEEVLGMKLAKIKSKDIDSSFELIKQIKGTLIYSSRKYLEDRRQARPENPKIGEK